MTMEPLTLVEMQSMEASKHCKKRDDARYLGDCLIRLALNGVPMPETSHRIGDRVERLVKPIAKALKLQCLDADGKLKPSSGCAKRRDKLNAL
jgi:hypothetical protein